MCAAATTCAVAMAAAQFQAKNAPIDAEADVSRDFDVEDAAAVANNVHVLICALDYKGTGHELTCTKDGGNFTNLCQVCGVRDIERLYDNQATKENVREKVKDMSSRVKDDDYFIFYYSGHGTQVTDEDGDEKEGKDEALCFVGPNGELEGQYFMSDDEFSKLLTSSFSKEVRLIIICDCCHSGSMTDMANKRWKDRDACSMSGCQDDQTSGDMGKGGIFTHSLLLALDDLVNNDTDEEITCALVYNTTLHEDDEVFNSAQDIAISTPKTTKPNAIPWPLIPPPAPRWRAPLRAAAAQVQAPSGGGGPPQQQQLAAVAQQFGVNPQLMSMLNQNQNAMGFLQQTQGIQDFLGQIPQVQGFFGSMFGEGYRPDQAASYMTGHRTQDCTVQ